MHIKVFITASRNDQCQSTILGTSSVTALYLESLQMMEFSS